MFYARQLQISKNQENSSNPGKHKILSKDQTLCVLYSHELLPTKIYFTSIYIFYILFTSRQLKSPKIIKIQQVHQMIHTKRFISYNLNCFLFVIHLDLK